MGIRYLSSAIAAGLFTCGLLLTAPASVSAQRSMDLPADKGPITLFGCFLRVEIPHEGNKYVLANPSFDTPATVPQAECNASADARMVELDDIHSNVHEHHLDKGKVGLWVEINGTLNKPKGQTLREVDVETYRLIPVAPPRVARAEPEPVVIQAPPEPAPEPAPVATTGVAEPLPKTASPLPLIALMGFVGIAGGFALRALGGRTI
jgi:hypothetical protein